MTFMDLKNKHHWTSASDWQKTFAAKSLFEAERALVLSSGSLTLMLEARLGSTVGIELQRITYTGLEPETARYLEESPDQRSMQREVWLTADTNRLVYAHTMIPLNYLGDELKRLLKSGSQGLGKILSNRDIGFTKDRLEVGVIKNDETAAGFGVDGKTPLLARRYRLITIGGSAEFRIKAAVYEVFGPELLKQTQLASEDEGSACK